MAISNYPFTNKPIESIQKDMCAHENDSLHDFNDRMKAAYKRR